MRLGLDQYTLNHLTHRNGVEWLAYATTIGFAGIQFGNVRQVSPTLDLGELKAASGYAAANGMYLEIGIPSINPHKPGPSIVEDGNGSLVDGIRRHLELVSASIHASKAVRVFVGGPSDHSRSNVRAFSEQISDTIAVAERIVPVLREYDLKLAFENHADIPTSDIIEIVHRLGHDVAGLCLDTGNIPFTSESPIEAVKVALPVTCCIHLKDAAVECSGRDIKVSPRPLGYGHLPIERIIDLIKGHSPHINVSYEDHAGEFTVEYNVTGRNRHSSTEYVRELHSERGEVPSPVEEMLWNDEIPWSQRAEHRMQLAQDFLNKIVCR